MTPETTMRTRSTLRCSRTLFLTAIAASAAACSVAINDNPPQNAIGPVAANADEAWPRRPTQPAALTPDEIALGCAAWAVCQGDDPNTVVMAEALASINLCALDIAWSAERAIPMGYLVLGELDERPEFFLRCAAEHEGDCEAIAACQTKRAAEIYCEEDGCRPDNGVTYTVTCEGTVATLKAGDKEHRRDCARAFTECDAKSPTGCTDRLYTQCSADNTGDHCDGAIRIGCDGAGQVSYRDCERLGGTCGKTATGAEGCVYTTPPEAPCKADEVGSSACEAGNLAMCILGKRVSVPAPAICPAASGS